MGNPFYYPKDLHAKWDISPLKPTLKYFLNVIRAVEKSVAICILLKYLGLNLVPLLSKLELEDFSPLRPKELSQIWLKSARKFPSVFLTHAKYTVMLNECGQFVSV